MKGVHIVELVLATDAPVIVTGVSGKLAIERHKVPRYTYTADWLH